MANVVGVYASNEPAAVPPRAEDRYIVESECPAMVFTMWIAPLTGAYERTLPPGLRFVVRAAPTGSETTVTVDPEPYDKWEPILVDPRDLGEIEYNGYCLRISLEDLRQFCRRLPAALSH